MAAAEAENSGEVAVLPLRLVPWTGPEVPEPWLEDEDAPEPGPLPPDPLAADPPADDAACLTAPVEDEGGPHVDPGPPGMPSEWLARMAPGVELAVELEGIDPRQADEYHLVEMIAAYQRMAAWAQSHMVHLAGVLSRRPALNPRSPLPGDESTMNVTAEELSPRLGVSRFAARRMVEAADAFRHKLEDTAVALHQGRIDYPKASVILRLLGDQPGDVAWEVQQLVLPNAPHQTITQLEKAITKAIIAVDPHRATARAVKARESRRVNHPRPLPDGMASMFAVLPATDAAGLDLALEAAARAAKAAGDTRTIDQLRADALALLGHSALERGYISTPGSEGSGPEQPPAPEPEGGCPTPETTEEPPADSEAASASEQPAARPYEPQPVSGGDGAEDDAPMFHTGNGFLRTPHMPIGTIGGQRAQVHVTIPLSVLIPPELLRHPDDPPTGAEGDRCVHGGPEPSPPDDKAPPDVGAVPDDKGPPDDDGLPADWYPGPTPAEVAELDGYGPITPDVAAALAYSAETWRRLITDPLSGQLLDVGRTRYRPPAAMAEFVQLRDRTCVSPTCSTPARSCELDHVVPWQFGGLTSADNLASSCGRDHQVKTSGAFQLRQLGAGTFEWTTPSGHRYRRDHAGRVSLMRGSAQDFGDEPPF